MIDKYLHMDNTKNRRSIEIQNQVEHSSLGASEQIRTSSDETKTFPNLQTVLFATRTLHFYQDSMSIQSNFQFPFLSVLWLQKRRCFFFLFFSPFLLFFPVCFFQLWPPTFLSGCFLFRKSFKSISHFQSPLCFTRFFLYFSCYHNLQVISFIFYYFFIIFLLFFYYFFIIFLLFFINLFFYYFIFLLIFLSFLFF